PGPGNRRARRGRRSTPGRSAVRRDGVAPGRRRQRSWQSVEEESAQASTVTQRHGHGVGKKCPPRRAFGLLPPEGAAFCLGAARRQKKTGCQGSRVTSAAEADIFLLLFVIGRRDRAGPGSAAASR